VPAVSAAEYAAKFPRYCHTCCGIGGTKSDPARMPNECPDCYGRGRCGRCAAELPKYEATCPACGWRAFNAADALPGAKYV
jgi:hypothetical protein